MESNFLNRKHIEHYLDLVMGETTCTLGMRNALACSISSLVMMIFTENGDLFTTLKTIVSKDVLITGRLIFLLV